VLEHSKGFENKNNVDLYKHYFRTLIQDRFGIRFIIFLAINFKLFKNKKNNPNF